MNNLSTHKQCPECKGKKIIWYEWSNGIAQKCETCKGTGEVPIFYTPAQYKEITGKDWPAMAPVWHIGGLCRSWLLAEYYQTKGWPTEALIIANEAGKPPSNYRPED